MRVWGRIAFLVFFLKISLVFAQDNLVLNGDFSNGAASWSQLGVYADAQASGGVTNGAYVISIQKSGPDIWNIQVTQPNIKMDSNGIYSFSFDASASTLRTIEANVEMNGGAYPSYSGIGTVALTGDMQRFSRVFVMAAHSDTNARVTFNCGKLPGDVTIDNVSLQKMTGPAVKLIAPSGGEQLSSGIPFDVQWLSVGITGKLTLEYSPDNGATWTLISDQIDNTGSYRWMAPAGFSPWGVVRLSSSASPAVYDINVLPFEIIPSVELVKNGYFTSGASGWSFGVYGGKASGAVTDGKYAITIDTPGTQNWQMQFSQTGLPLVSGKTYVLSFVANAAAPCTINVNVGMSVSPYTSYMDTTKSPVGLSVEPKKTVIEFTMALPTDTNARIEFNCGLARSSVYLDKVSLTQKNIVSTAVNPAKGFSYRKLARTRVFASMKRSGLLPFTRAETWTVVDARGRCIGSARMPGEKVRETLKKPTGSGMYFGYETK